MLSNSYIFSFKKFIFNHIKKIPFFLLSALIIIGGPSVFFFFDQNAIIASSLQDETNISNNNYDVLLMGDSRAHQGIDPNFMKEQFREKYHKDLSIYNMGRPAMQTPFFYLILKDYILEHKSSPKVIVLNLSFYLLGTQRGLMEDIYFTHYKPKLNQIVESIKFGLIKPAEGASWYFVSRFPPLKYRKKIRSTVESFLKGDFFGPFADISLYHAQFNPKNLGYYSRGAETFNPFNASPYAYKAGVYEDPVYLRFLEEFFSLCEKNGIHLVIYSFPWPEQLQTNEMKEILLHYDTLIKSKSQRFSHVHYIDKHHFWPSNLFSDQQHLNQRGTEQLSSYLIETVKEYMQ